MPPKISPPQLKPPSKPTIDSRIPHKVATVNARRPHDFAPNSAPTHGLGRDADNQQAVAKPEQYRRNPV